MCICITRRRRLRDDARRGRGEAIHNIVITASTSSYSVLKRFTAVIIYPLKGYAGDKLYVTYTPIVGRHLS